MIVLGSDPHKSSHTATAVDPATNTDLGSIRIDATRARDEAFDWLGQRPGRSETGRSRTPTVSATTWRSVAADFRGDCLDVPTTATARVRELSRGGRRKNDRIDAAAYVAALQGDVRPVDPDDPTEVVVGLLDERRTNPSSTRTRAPNSTRCCSNCSPGVRRPH